MNLTCSICMEPFIEPTTLPCGHTFCMSECESMPNSACGICREPFKKETLKPNIDMCAGVATIPMQCPVCKETFPREGYREHKRTKHPSPVIAKPKPSIQRPDRTEMQDRNAEWLNRFMHVAFGDAVQYNFRDMRERERERFDRNRANHRIFNMTERRTPTRVALDTMANNMVFGNRVVPDEVQIIDPPTPLPFIPIIVNYNKLRYESTWNTTAATLRSDIERDGVAVIHSVLTSEEVTHAISLGNAFLGNVFVNNQYNVQMNNPASWKNVSKYMFVKHGGLQQHFHAGQCEMSWFCRTRPAVRAIFERLWSTNLLFCSFDGFNITPPPEQTNCGWQPPFKHWLHTDQSERKIGLESVQGLVNLVDVDEGDATLMVLKGSNRHHAAFFAHFRVHASGDWFMLKPEHVRWFLDRGCEPIAISARAGDMIFWDSRTIHMGLGPSRRRSHPDRWRYVVYVAMFNAALLTDHDIAKRVTFVTEGRTSNHWGLTAFPKLPRTWGNELPEQRPYDQIPLSQEASALIDGS